MAILYTLEKTLDDFVLEVQQDTDYELYYTSDGANSLVISATLAADTPLILPATKDGHYKLTLKVETEIDVLVEFDVIKYLQDSIISEAQYLICNLTNTACNDKFTANCLSEAGKQCLTHKSVFVKLLTFQTLYIPTYGSAYSGIFTNFLEQGALLYKCKLQTSINRILSQECVTGSAQDTEKLFKLYVALYWAGMYFIEEALAEGDQDQLDFVKQKFEYDCIVPCLCSLCLDIEDLRNVFTTDPNNLEITSFQFNGIEFDIDDIALLTPTYLATYGEVQPEGEMLGGKNITFTNLGRVGFVIKNTSAGRYLIFDALNNDITTTVFDQDYNADTLTETFVAKDYSVPSTIFFKFVKV